MIGWPWRRRQLVCRQAVALVTDYLEGALPRRERALLEQHLAACPHCATYLEQLRVTVAALGRVDPEALPREMQDDLIALFRGYQASS